LLPLLAKVDVGILDAVELFLCCGVDWEAGAYTVPPELPLARTHSWDAFLASGSADFVWPDVPETSLHALCYTSGTTGSPKGAGYSHRSTYLHTLMAVGADQLAIRGSDVVLPFVPMFHVLSWGVPFINLMLGTRTVFSGNQMEADKVLDMMIDWKVQVSTGVPTVWQGVRAAIEKRGLRKVAANFSLRMLTCGGSAPPPDLMRWYMDNLGVEFLQAWGMTETNPLGSLSRRVAKHKDLAKTPEQTFANCTKAGLPAPGLEVRIANPEDWDKDMPHGEPGELMLRGPWVIAEYYRYKAEDKFHNGWLVTGDVAKLDEEGAIIITDRSKDVIKSGGEWISSIDLENHIAGLGDISIAAVVSVPHPRWDERPVAVVSLSDPGAAKGLAERVTQHCLKSFAKFQVPDDVVVWDEIPLTSTGKLDKKRIREKLAKEGYVLPTTREPKSKL